MAENLEQPHRRGAENFGLVPENLVERRPGHARRARDVVHRCFSESVIDEDIESRGNDRAALVRGGLEHHVLTI
jgi:hypothetical protein